MSEQHSAWTSACLIAAVVAISIGVASHFLLEKGLDLSRPSLEEATETGAAAVGQAIAGQFAHALQLGIPLEKLPGVEAYLRRIVDHSPQVEGLAILDDEGRTLYATAEAVEGATYSIAGSGSQAAIVVSTRSPLIDQAITGIHITLAIAAALAGVVSGCLMFCFVYFHRRPALDRFANSMERMTAGDFSTKLPVEERGAMAEASRALSRCMARVTAARRTLIDAILTIRAIDFDGSLGRRVDAITKPLEGRYRFAEDTAAESVGNEATGGMIWRAVLFIGLYGAAFPFVANFAMDRESEVVSAAWAPVMPFLAELAAVAAGALAGTTRAGSSALSRLFGCLLLAACLATTYWCRSYDQFVLLRTAAGFSLGLVVSGLLLRHNAEVRLRDVILLMVFSALLAAPLASGLYAEAIGRRSAFLVIGIVVLFATLFVATGVSSDSRSAQSSGTERINAADLAIGITAMAAGPTVLVLLPSGIGFDAYLIGGAGMAILAACTLLVPTGSTLVAAAGLLLSSIAFFLESRFSIFAAFAGCAFLGLACGATLSGTLDNAKRPWTAMGTGVAAGLILAGISAQVDLPFAVVIALGGVAMATLHLTSRPQAATAGG